MTDAEAQTVVVTGGNTGLGYECAKTLATRHPSWTIVIASRNANAALAAERIGGETGNQHVMTMPLDLASLASVRHFTEQFAERDLPPLRAVVCNAGIQIVSGTSYTEDGFETTFGVNHLGHFLLINLLLPQISAPARIVLVASGTHNPDEPFARFIGGYAPRFRDAREMAYPERFPDPAERDESAVMIGRHRYGTSKLCNVFCAYELARRIAAAGLNEPGRAITVNAFDPGLMPGTGLAREAGAVTRFAWSRVLPLLSDRVPNVHRVPTSGANLAWLVDAPELADTSGLYFEGRQAKRSSVESYDQAKARRLWEQSAELVGLAVKETVFAPAVAV